MILKNKFNLIFYSFIFLFVLIICFFFLSLRFAKADAPAKPAGFSSIEPFCYYISDWYGNFVFTWENPAGQNINKYYVRRNSDVIMVSGDIYGNSINDDLSSVVWQDNTTNLVSGNFYQYELAAVNSYDEVSEYSDAIVLVAPYCPAPVLTIDANYCVGLDSRVDLSWIDSGNISFFNIYRKKASDEFFQIINQIPNEVKNWTNNGLTNGQEYIYYVQAVGSGWELDSDEISATTLNCAGSIIPSPPPVLTLLNLCAPANEITLNWTASEHTNVYDIHKSFTFEGFPYDITWSVDSNSFTFPDQGNADGDIQIKHGIEYTYYIEAVNNANTDNPVSSNIESITFDLDCSVPGDPPDDPTNLSTQSRCDITNDPVMRFSWDPVSDVTGYRIYRREISTEGSYSYYGFTNTDADTGTGAFDFDDEEVTAGLIYYYGVEAINTSGSSNRIYYEISAPVSVCVLPVAPILLDDISSECDGFQDSKVIINWSQNPYNSSNPDSNTGYFEIYQEGVPDILIHSTADNTVYVYEDLDDATSIESNVNYTYYVKAIGAVGQTPTESNRQTIHTEWCLPTSPENLSAGDVCDGAGYTDITLTWDNSKNTDHYELYRSDDGSLGSQISANAVSGIVNTVDGAVDTFYYTVRAVGNDGINNADSLISITTQDCTSLESFSIDAVSSITQCSDQTPSFHLVWEEVETATYYEVYRQRNEAGYTLDLVHTTSDGTTHSYDDDDVESGIGYFYMITAYKSADSENSDAVLFDIDWCPPDLPTALDNAQSCNGNQPEVSLSWTVSLNTASYEIYRRLDNLAVTAGDYIGTSASSPFLDNTVSNNGTYYYTVRAIGNDAINTADSTPAYQVIVGNCQIPGQSQISLASLCNGPDPYIGLSWTAVSGAASYDIHKVQGASIIPDAGNLFLDDIVLLIYNDDVVASGNTYSYVSLACSLGGCSSYNNPLDVTESIYVEYCDPELPVLNAVASCDGLGNSVVDLNWIADTTGNLDYYRVARDIGGVGFVVLDDNLVNTADAYINDQNNPLAPAYPPADSTNYTYYLTLVGYNSDWATSTVDILTYDCTLPNEPTITTASAGCDICYPFVYLDWTDVLDFSVLPETKYYEVQQDGATIFNTQDIVGMWHFNGNTNDESIYGNHGTNNGATFVAGNFGQALNFDGSSYIDCGNDLSLDIANEITVSAWVRISSDCNGRIVSKHGSDYGWMLSRGNNDNIEWRISTTGSDWIGGHTFENSFEINTWYYITAVYDGNFMRVYIDGIEDNSGDFPVSITGNINIAPAPTQIGKDDISGVFFNGDIDEVVIYSRALSSNEIRGAYRQGEHSHPTASEYYDYSVASPNSYNYTVIAGNIGGENSDSAGPIAVSWCDASAPSDFVLSQVCDGLGNSNVDLIWDQDAPENVSHYIIERYNSDVGIIDILESSLDSSLRTYLDDSLPFNETNYDYSIVAVGNSGNYATSTQSILTDDCSLPGATNITVYNSECNGVAPFIDLSWTNIANADYYVVSQDGSDIFDTRNKIAALYHFDEGSGIDIEDATEIKENGSIVSGTPQWVAGKIGNALDFSNGRRVEIPDSDNSVFDFKNCFTLEAWVNSEGSSSRDYVIYKDSVYYFTIYNNKINWYLYNAHCGNDCWSARCHIDTGVNINVNEWTHIAMVYDKNTVTIYKNGNEEIASFPAYGLVYPVNNNPVRIGYSFQGAIDEVKVVGKALSPAEILADYNDGNAGINLTVPSAGNVVDFDDYNVLANNDPWYLGESHTYEVTTFNLGGNTTSAPATATFDNPTDACVPGVSYQTDTSVYCVADNPGVCYPYIHFEWGDFMPGNSGISNADVRTSSAYRLVIDSVLKADVLPTSGTYWCGGGRREHVYFRNDISDWGKDDDADHSISLRITNVNGLTQDSSVRDINIPFCAAPSDITNFTVTPGCNGDQAKVDLDWDDDPNNYTNSYYVVREKQGGGTEPSSLNFEESIDVMSNNHNEGLCYKDGIFYRTAWYNTAGGELFDSNGVSYDTESWSNDLNGIVWDSIDNCFWFSDDQHNDIVKTDENFNFISRFDISGEIYSQRGITTDGTYLYIVDSGHYEDYRYSGAIFVYNKDGSLHKKIDMSLMAHGSWNGHGIAYLNGYLYVGTDGGVHYESVYAINVSQIADGIVSIQAIFDTSSYVCSYGVKGVATDGSNLFLADYCYTPFYKFSIVKSGNEIKYVNTALVSEYENFGDLEVNSAYDYYILATGNNYSYNISATIATTTPSACYNAPLEPSVSYVTPKCDNSANSYMEVKWNAIVEENNTDDYDLYRIDDLLNNDIIINGIGDNNFGSLTSGSDNCSSIIDIDSGLLVITCEDYELILTTGYKYYLKANGPGGTVQSIDYPLDFVNPIDCNATPEIPANFSVASDCMGYCNGGNDNGNFCAGDSDCDSADCTISFLNGGSENLKWDRMQNAFQYVISRYCDGTYDNTITIGEIGYSSYDPDNPDVSYFDTYVKYIDHIPFEFINKDCLYTVIAKGYGGDSDPTDLLGDTVPVCGNTPAAPTNLDLSNIKCDETTISWSDITDIGEVGNDPPNNPGTGGEFYYNVYQDYDFTGPVLIAQKLSPINSGETQTFSATGLVEEKNYSWLIEAWNPAGTSTSTISTITAKCGPQNLVLKRKLSSCEKVELYWKRAENYLGFENAKRYEVYRAESISNIFDDVQYLGNSCSGDFDDDGKVDGHDLIDMNWQIANNADCSSLPCIGDLDGDNDVDSNDQNEFDSQYGRRDCLLKDYDCSDGACYRNINLIIGCSVYTDPCRGDIDSDGDVDGDDLTIMDAQIATNSDCAVMPCIGDLDGDNDVDNNDRGLLTSELGRGDCSDCDLDCSDGVCYDINTKTYKFIDYYNLNDHSEQFLTGTKYYYIVKGLPVEPAIEHGNSNVLKIQPCPYLPEWRDARPE